MPTRISPLKYPPFSLSLNDFLLCSSFTLTDQDSHFTSIYAYSISLTLFSPPPICCLLPTDNDSLIGSTVSHSSAKVIFYGDTLVCQNFGD